MKRIILLLLVTIILLSAIHIVYAAEIARDPFKGIAADDYDHKVIGSRTILVNNGRLAGANIGDWFVYRNVNFSQSSEKFEITVAVPEQYAGKIIELRIDKPDGQLVGSILTQPTAGFAALGVNEGKVEIENLQGIHDLYIIFKTGVGQVGSITFYPVPKGIIKTNTNTNTNTNSTVEFKDILNTPYEKSIRILSNLGIIYGNEGKFNPNEPVTRAEFTVFTLRMLGLNSIENNGSGSVFKDVPKGHWAVGSIEAANKLGMINGFEGGGFGPDDYILYNEAVKMIVCALGYKELAVVKGGYPDGYISVAFEIGILKNVKIIDVDDYDAFKRDIAAQLLYNAINADFLKPQSYGDKVKYQKIKEDGVLGSISSIYKRDGIVTGTGVTRLTMANTPLKLDEIEINGIRFNVGESDIMKYLGYKITYYYKLESATGERTILYAEPHSSNEEIVIDYKQIDGIDNNKIKYTPSENDKQKNLTISAGTSVIYNGKALDSINYNTVLNLHNEMLNINNPTNPITIPFSGDIKWIDNDSDGIGNVLIINSPIIYMMKGYRSTNGKLEDYYEKPALEFDISSDNEQLIIQKDEKDASFYSITKDSALTVYQSINTNGKKLIRLVISDNSIRGKIEEIYDDGSKLVIGGKEYELCEEYNIAVRNNISGVKSLKVGLQGTFILDALGRIAAFDNTIVDNDIIKAGILIDYIAITSGIDPIVEFRIFSEENKTITCISAKKVTIDGETGITGATEINNKLDAVRGLQYSVIRYRTNLEGKLDLIDTYKQNTGEYDDTLNILTKNFDGDREVKLSQQYRQTGGYFGQITSNANTFNYPFKKNLIVFYVPDRDSNVRDEGKYYSIINLDKLSNIRYDIELYNNDIYSSLGEILVVYNNQFRITNTDDYNDCMVVDKITNVIDEDGNTLKKVKGYFNGNERNYLFSDDYSNDITSPAYSVDPSTLKAGDVFRLKFDSKSRLLIRDIIISSDNLSASKNIPGEAPGFLYGNQSRVEGNMMTFVDKANKVHNFNIEAAKVLMFNTENQKLQITNSDDLINNLDDIFVFISNYTANMIVIYKQ